MTADEGELNQQRAAIAFYNAYDAHERATLDLRDAMDKHERTTEELARAEKAFVDAAKVEAPPDVALVHTRANRYAVVDSVVSNYGGQARCERMARLYP